MSALMIGKWRAIVAAKTRRRERREQDLVRERAALAERQDGLDAALVACREAERRCAAQQERIDAMTGEAALSTTDYLRHDAWRAELKAALEAERKAERKCRTALDRQRERVELAAAALARAGAALDQCNVKLRAVLRAAAHTAELAAEDEATDNLLARRYAMS